MNRIVTRMATRVPGDGDWARTVPRGLLEALVVTDQWRPSELSCAFAVDAVDPTTLGPLTLAGTTLCDAKLDGAPGADPDASVRRLCQH